MQLTNAFISIVVLVSVLDAAVGFSGWYVDNGGQTVIDETIPTADTQQMQHEILQLLGLPHRPQTERFPSVIRLVFYSIILWCQVV